MQEKNCSKKSLGESLLRSFRGYFIFALYAAIHSKALAQQEATAARSMAAEKSRSQQKPPSASLTYALDRVNFAGITNASLKQKQTGLEAEIFARKNGIESLQAELQKSCNAPAIKENWQDSIKSLGSEVYADHTFKIILAGNLSELIDSASAPAEILSLDNKALLFRIPAAVPFSSTRCGTLSLQLPEGKSINVFPTRYSKGKPTEGHIAVSLALSKTGNLYPVGTHDKENVRQSNLEALASQFQNRALTISIVP